MSSAFRALVLLLALLLVYSWLQSQPAVPPKGGRSIYAPPPPPLWYPREVSHANIERVEVTLNGEPMGEHFIDVQLGDTVVLGGELVMKEKRPWVGNEVPSSDLLGRFRALTDGRTDDSPEGGTGPGVFVGSAHEVVNPIQRNLVLDPRRFLPGEYEVHFHLTIRDSKRPKPIPETALPPLHEYDVYDLIAKGKVRILASTTARPKIEYSTPFDAESRSLPTPAHEID